MVYYIILYLSFIIAHLWLKSHPRSTLVILDIVAHGTSREDTVRLPMERLELVTSRLEIECSSN